MAEEIITTTAVEPVIITQAQPTVALQPEQTQPTAVNVGIDAIIAQAEQKAAEAAEKKMTGVFKSMLEQQGFDAEAINNMTAEWKSKQITPEQTIQQLQNELQAERDRVTAYQQEKILRSYGLNDDEDIEIYSIRINKLVSDGKTFEQAAQEYFEAHPRPTKIPATATFNGTGKTPMYGILPEDFKKMGYAERLKLKQENPALYENMKGR